MLSRVTLLVVERNFNGVGFSGDLNGWQEQRIQHLLSDDFEWSTQFVAVGTGRRIAHEVQQRFGGDEFGVVYLPQVGSPLQFGSTDFSEA